jgi:hypothetical protein
MEITVTLTVQVEVEATHADDQQAITDVQYEVDKALDYWFSHTARPMTSHGVSLQGRS